jgi:YVTN family beta-propeller protein
VVRRDAGIVTVVNREDGSTNPIAVGGGQPTALSLDQGHLWVLSSFSNGSLVQIDTGENRVVGGTIELGSGASDVAAGDGSVWVTNSFKKELVRIDERVGTKPDDAYALSIEPVAVAVGGGSVWVAGGKTLVRIDPATGEPQKSITLSSDATDLAYGAGGIWVLHSADDKVTRVRFDVDDPSSVQVSQTIQVGDAPVAIAVDDDAAWIANSTSGTVSRIDTGTSAVTATIDVGSAPAGVAVSNGWVWVSAEEH